MPAPYRIGLLGLGHVGGALARRLVEDADRIATAAGRPIALEAIAVAHPQGRSAPAPLRYATAGTGSTQHIAAEAFAKATGTRLVHVPYKGSSQAHVDLLGGQVEMMFDTSSSAMGQIKAGRLRPIAVTTPQRSRELPDAGSAAGCRARPLRRRLRARSPRRLPVDPLRSSRFGGLWRRARISCRSGSAPTGSAP